MIPPARLASRFGGFLCLLLCLAVLPAGCKKKAQLAGPPPPPLGPNAKKFYGSTTPKSLFDPLFTPPCKPTPSPTPKKRAGGDKAKDSYMDDPTLRALTILADMSDHRFTGTPAERTAYRNAKMNDYETNTNAYWKESSYGQVDIDFTMPDRIVEMSGAFDDYFNRPFAPASLTTRGLTGKYPLALDGSATATIHVRDAHDRNKDVAVAPNGNFPNAAALALA